MGIEDRDYFKNKKDSIERKKRMKDMYVDDDGKMYTEEEWNKRKGKTTSTTNTQKNKAKEQVSNSNEKITITATVSTEELYNNKDIKIFYNNSFFQIKLDSKMKDNEIYSYKSVPFLIKIKLLNKNDYQKYKNNITYKTIEIDPDTAKFGGNYRNINIPNNTQDLDVIKINTENLTQFITIKVISFDKYEKLQKQEQDRIKKQKEIDKENNKSFFEKNWKIIIGIIIGGGLILAFPWFFAIVFILLIIVFANK